MSRTFLFAYGSNMHPERMRARVAGAVSHGRARLEGHRLVFNKRGRDGSAKANLAVDSETRVWGVVWELATEELIVLDRYEGGYRRIETFAQVEDGSSWEVEVYVSERLTDDPTPYDWYLEHVVRGARAHGFPDAYVAEIERLPSRPDDSGEARG